MPQSVENWNERTLNPLIAEQLNYDPDLERRVAGSAGQGIRRRRPGTGVDESSGHRRHLPSAGVRRSSRRGTGQTGRDREK